MYVFSYLLRRVVTSQCLCSIAEALDTLALKATVSENTFQPACFYEAGCIVEGSLSG